MLLDALMRLKAMDDTLSFRRSCREGVCGSDAMNINGKNGLACITNLNDVKEPVELRPLPGLPVIRDLIVDMSQFFKQYHSIKPYVINDTPPPSAKRLQSPEDREELDGLYECILCACCSTSCPSFWWNPDKFVGPPPASCRRTASSPTAATRPPRRLDNLEDPYRLFRCHDHELRRRPRRAQSDARHRQDQGDHGQARPAGLGREGFRPAAPTRSDPAFARPGHAMTADDEPEPDPLALPPRHARERHRPRARFLDSARGR